MGATRHVSRVVLNWERRRQRRLRPPGGQHHRRAVDHHVHQPGGRRWDRRHHRSLRHRPLRAHVLAQAHHPLRQLALGDPGLRRPQPSLPGRTAAGLLWQWRRRDRRGLRRRQHREQRHLQQCLRARHLLRHRAEPGRDRRRLRRPLHRLPAAAASRGGNGVVETGEAPATTATSSTTTLAATPACAPPGSDGVRNQGETGVDCGGPCTACSTSGCLSNMLTLVAAQSSSTNRAPARPRSPSTATRPPDGPVTTAIRSGSSWTWAPHATSRASS